MVKNEPVGIQYLQHFQHVNVLIQDVVCQNSRNEQTLFHSLYQLL